METETEANSIANTVEQLEVKMDNITQTLTHNTQVLTNMINTLNVVFARTPSTPEQSGEPISNMNNFSPLGNTTPGFVPLTPALSSNHTKVFTAYSANDVIET